MSYLIRLLRKNGGAFVITFLAGQLCMLLAAAAGLAFPWAVRGLFGSILDSGQIRRLVVSVVALGGVLVARDVAIYLRRKLMGRIGERIVFNLRERIYDSLLTRSFGLFAKSDPGEVGSAASNDIHEVQRGLTEVLTGLIEQVVTLGAVISMMFIIEPRLAALILLIVPPTILIGRIMSKRAERTTEKHQRVLGEIMGVIQQTISGIEIIRSYLLEGAARRIYREQNRMSFDASVRNIEIGAAASFWSGLLGNLFLIATMAIGGVLVVSNSLTAPDLIAFILYAEMLAGPFVALSSLVPSVARSRTAYRRIQDLLDQETELFTGSRHVPDPGSVRGNVEFDSVSFAYDDSCEVLSSVSLVARPGELLALVGPSGAGKSTIARLLPRLYDPVSGAILIDGVDIRSYSRDDLRSLVGLVPQNPYVFNMSIGDNIRCGNPDASEDEIVAAAESAGALDFIQATSDGFETIVGSDAGKLSGGQRQRIAIARCFLKNPRILILDEATSALDGMSETTVTASLSRLYRGRTTIVIAHRLATVTRADRIVVLDGGRVVDSGSHSELHDRCALYHDLAKTQFDSVAAVTSAASA